MLPFIIAGLTTGSIFALAAVGLVLTYKTSGIFNFAHGALASGSAFLFYFLAEQCGIPWGASFAICVLIAGPLAGLLLELMARHLSGAPLAMKVLATVGVLLAIQGLIDVLYSPGVTRTVPQYLPGGSFQLGSTVIADSQLITFALGLVVVVLLTVFLRFSTTGLAMRAVVDNSRLLDIMGIDPARVRRIAWMLGTMMASASGVLLAPLLPLDSTTMTFLVVTAFGAAAVGAFTSLPLTYLGGLAIGVGQALLQEHFVSSTGLVSGLSSSLPFLVLFVLLLCAPRLRSPSSTVTLARTAVARWRPRWEVRGAGAVITIAVLACAPLFVGDYLDDWTSFLSYVIVFLSLGLLVRMSGQVSLAHVTFMAIGVCAFSDMASAHHWPWLAALLFAAIVAMPIGAVLAIPAIRFPGLYLALATLGFGILVEQMFYGQSYMFGALGSVLTIPRPFLSWLNLASDDGYYYLVLVIAALIAALVFFLHRSRLGRLLRAMADSPRGLASSGTSINVSRVLVFCLSASIAAVGGVLNAGVIGVVSGDGYQPLLSIQLFILVLLAVGEAPWYALVAALGQVLIPAYISTGATIGYALSLIFGLGAIAISIAPHGALRLPAFAQNLLGSLSAPAGKHSRVPEPVPLESAVRPGSDLVINDVTVRFGGLTAADGISVTARAGGITGLIGPNGAGKSTLFNVASGYVRPTAGSVRIDGRELGRLSASARARLGLGRTFQHTELFDSMTVRQNIALGAEAAYAGQNPLAHILSRRAQRSAIAAATGHSLALCDLDQLADTPVSILSTGQRRLAELARCLAGSYGVILLDEPSSGLDRTETQRFGAVLQRITAERGVAILLVEHDMSLVSQVCQYVYVIDFGKPIFEGTVTEMGASLAVRQAYLGEDGLEANGTRATEETPA
jgi:ABC-type branched-subunit amino acid transport system ATPase component/branched-subunit amino acid ABC-type transport system permease component